MAVSRGLFSTGYTGCIHFMNIMKYTGDFYNGGDVKFNDPALTEKIKGMTCEKMCTA
jgi:hypothetical protein